MSAKGNDRATVAAIGVIAMCTVTADHEALGHGSVCLFLHGEIVLLTSPLFRCSVQSGWIDAGGPAVNLLMGGIAWLLRTAIPARFLKLRLSLALVTALSFFWEGGYLIKAMLDRKGDLYDFADFLLGHVGPWLRVIAAAAGLAVYLFAARLVSRTLHQMWPVSGAARAVACTAWVAVAVAAAMGGAVYTGHSWGNFRDAILEAGVASLPLLLAPLRSNSEVEAPPVRFITRSYATILFALVIYASFLATLERGLNTLPLPGT